MFTNNTALKQEVIRYFKKECLNHFEVLCNGFKGILFSYKDDEIVETMDRMVIVVNVPSNPILACINDIKNLCDNEYRVFSDVKDYDVANTINALKNIFIELEKDILAIAIDIPENKNEAILLQAEKIKLFRSIFEETETPLYEYVTSPDNVDSVSQEIKTFVTKLDSNNIYYIIKPMMRAYDMLDHLIIV